MNTNATPQQIEKLNYLATGLLAAAGAHIVLIVLSVSGMLAASSPGFLGILVTVLKVSWTAAGFFGAAYVAYNTFFMLNGRDYHKARIAAIGALVLPLFGASGVITAFALIPLGGIALYLFRQPAWKAVFGIEEAVLTPAGETQTSELDGAQEVQ
jgi:hypothetical protein